MKTILVISDQSPEAAQAALLALSLARRVQADLILATTVKARRASSFFTVIAGTERDENDDSCFSQLCELNIPGKFVPQINKLDISAYTLADLIKLIFSQDIWLIVDGLPAANTPGAGLIKPNLQSVLNQVRCPLLLVPEGWTGGLPGRVTYLTDLRYCRQQVLRFTGELCRTLQVPLAIAHVAARGLTDVSESYADILFHQDILPYTTYNQVTLSNIREKDLHKAVDVLIHGMHQELLVFVNHRYHFEELIGRCIGDTMPADLTVPALIFPL